MQNWNIVTVSFGLKVRAPLCSYTEHTLAVLPQGQQQRMLFSEVLNGTKKDLWHGSDTFLTVILLLQTLFGEGPEQQ